MNTSFQSLIAIVLLIGTGTAMAASSVDLTVRGLITPSACEPSVSNGGVADIGKIAAKDLSADQETYLPYQYLQLAVRCDAATLMAVEAKDNREGSSYDDNTMRFGLGLINGAEKLGSMELRVVDPVADGVTPWMIGSQDGGSTWIREHYFKRDNILSVGTTGIAAPIPVLQFTSNLRIQPIIAPTNGLTLDNEVAIDGSATLTVKYL